MTKKYSTQKEVIRTNGKHREVLSFHNDEGDLLHKIIRPLMFELELKDIVQITVGATILGIPVGYTQEVWDLGATLPFLNIIFIAMISMGFMSIFIYSSTYHGHLQEHWMEFGKRLLATYVISLLVVGMILTLIGQAPWMSDFFLAFKRAVLVSLPASLSASLTDMIK